MSAVLPSFVSFIADLRAVWARESGLPRRMELATERLGALVRDPALQKHTESWPSTEGHKNLLLHSDDEHGFVVNAVVRVPGRFGSVHDHAHAYTAYGVCHGAEYLERYERLDDGSREGFADIKLVSTTIGTAGVVDLVPPWAIHAEQGGDRRSCAIIIRSERLVGKVLQGNYDAAAKTVAQRSGPTQVPYELKV